MDSTLDLPPVDALVLWETPSSAPFALTEYHRPELGDCTLGATLRCEMDYSQLRWAAGQAYLDRNGSGDLDLAVFFNGGFGISEAYLFLNTGAGMEAGQVLGGFYASGALVSLASTAEQEALLLGGDSVLRMGPDGLVEEIGSETSFFYAATAGDLDDDGEMDLLSFVSEEAVLYASSLEGPLSLLPISGLDVASSDAVVFDLDGDGREDLAGVRWDSVEEQMVLESWLNVSGD